MVRWWVSGYKFTMYPTGKRDLCEYCRQGANVIRFVSQKVVLLKRKDRLALIEGWSIASYGNNKQDSELRFMGALEERVGMETTRRIVKCFWKATCPLLESREWSPVYIFKKLVFKESFWKKHSFRIFTLCFCYYHGKAVDANHS